MRPLFEEIGDAGQNLTGLKLKNINLNDNEIIEELCSFLYGNQSMQKLEMSACRLQAKHLVAIAEVLPHMENLMVLDLSENVVSEHVPVNNVSLTYFLYLLAGYLKTTKTLYSLNLQGLLLGKKLIPFLDSIIDNKTLMQINLSKNLISKEL